MPRRAGLAAVGALGGIALLVLTWYATFHVALAQRADQEILQGFTDLARPGLDRITQRIATLCSPNPYVYLAAIPPAIALVRRRWHALVAVCTIELGANVTTQLLKPLLAAARPSNLLHGVGPIAPASWPSGHATAAMALTLSLILAMPQRWRPWIAALGAAFTVAVVFSFLTLAWHFPSDVFGGFLVSTTWTLAAVACVWSLDRRRGVASSRAPSRERLTLPIVDSLAPAAALLVVAAGLAGLVVIARPHQVVAYTSTHHAFMIGAAALGATALAIATGVMLALRR
jgi:membrane-associated phospholipid phosphatase